MTISVQKAGTGLIAVLGASALYWLSQVSIVPPVSAEAEVASAAESVTPAAAVEPSANTAVADASAAAPAGPDAAAGKAVFGKCKACHTNSADAKNGVGPALHGVVNRGIASVASYKYSDAMQKNSAGKWTPEELDKYLADPKAAVPGNKMAFPGLPNAADRANLIAYLAEGADAPAKAAAPDSGAAAAAPEQAEAAATPPAAPAASAAPAAPEQTPYTDPPAPTAEQLAAEAAKIEALRKIVPTLDYERARYYPLHFKPAIDTASDGECLVCHSEVLGTNVRETSPAGVKAADSLAWYQTLATYDGAQATFHQRHISTPYAKAVMNLSCNFCHQGNDPREESPTMTVSAADMTSNNGAEPFTNRKMVNTSETCLRCHGAMPDPVNIMGLPGPFPQVRADLESADAPNACLTCHQDAMRTNRHNVTYLKAATIEDLAKEGSDVCYGCHGGRAWYRISYPYPRHAWPAMDTTSTPDWAKNRPTESDARYQRKAAP